MEKLSQRIMVIIPAWNEEDSIGMVLREIPWNLVTEVIVSDNGSTDSTSIVARNHGATVVYQPMPGYGNACLKAMEYIEVKPIEGHPDIIVFLDGDYSDYPSEMSHLIAPIREKGFDMVIGSRALGHSERGAMQPQQIFGNWLATRLIKLFFGYSFTDLGPFRAITWSCLLKMNMADQNYGWTVEMQVKATKMGLKCTEVPVSYRKRVGVSKVSGTIKGSILAGYKILWIIFKNLFS